MEISYIRAFITGKDVILARVIVEAKWGLDYYSSIRLKAGYIEGV
jgi:hypothetical protein